MIWALLLLACRRDPVAEACDTHPDELVVEDPDDVASVRALDAARVGLDAFRSWTARDAICVSSIRFHAEIPRNEGFSEDFDPAGRYVSSTDEILLEDGEGWTAIVTTHELCHALDYTEGMLSTQYAHLFDPESFDPAYPESHQLREAFADACMAGPGSRLREALASECSVVPFEPDEVELFLREVVYTGVESWDVPEIVRGTLAVDWIEVAAPGASLPDVTVESVNITWDGIAGRTLDHADETGTLWILALDGSVVAQADAGPFSYWIEPVPWNLGAAYWSWAPEDTSGRVLYRDGRVVEAPGLSSDEGVELVWDDVVFVRTDDGLATRDLWTGAPVDSGLDPEWLRVRAASASATVVRDGVYVGSEGEGWIGTPTMGWTWAGAPSASVGPYTLTTSSYPHETGSTTVLVGLDPDGRVHTGAEPCEALQGNLHTPDGTPWVLAHAMDEVVRFGPVVLADGP